MFQALTLKKKILFTFASVFAVAAVLIVVALANTTRLGQATSSNDRTLDVNHTYDVINQGDGMLINMINIETGIRGFVASGLDPFLEPFDAGKIAFAEYFDRAKTLTSDNPAQQARLDKIRKHHNDFLAVADDLAALRRVVNAGNATLAELQAEFQVGRDKEAMDAFRSEIGAFLDVEEDLLGKRMAAVENVATTTTNILVIGGLVLAAMTFLLGFNLMRSLYVQLGAEPAEVVELAGQVANGNLTANVSLRPGDQDSLMAKMAKMNTNLSALVSGVRSIADGVASTSHEFVAANSDLSHRTEEQAKALTDTSASMEELGATVRLNVDSARQANDLALGASEVATRGGEVVGQVVETMKSINDSSRQIADIISVIDGIAFQTNILALNAAVEAARAGEQGRGFAVVASEVRGLAQRSADAAKEISGLITTSVERVEQGSQLVDQAGTTMDEIVVAIKNVTGIVADISQASSEQSDGVAQAGEAVQQIDHWTQQNTALVEETAAAAEALRQQADELVGAVAKFETKA